MLLVAGVLSPSKAPKAGLSCQASPAILDNELQDVARSAPAPPATRRCLPALLHCSPCCIAVPLLCCRVVNVASVTHRMGVIGADPCRDFLQGDFGHYYWVGGLLLLPASEERLTDAAQPEAACPAALALPRCWTTAALHESSLPWRPCLRCGVTSVGLARCPTQRLLPAPLPRCPAEHKIGQRAVCV